MDAALNIQNEMTHDEQAGGWIGSALASLPPGTLLDEKGIAAALQVSTRTIRRMVSRGELPAGVKLGGRKVWMSDKVLSFIAEKAERSAVAAHQQARRLGERF